MISVPSKFSLVFVLLIESYFSRLALSSQNPYGGGYPQQHQYPPANAQQDPYGQQQRQGQTQPQQYAQPQQGPYGAPPQQVYGQGIASYGPAGVGPQKRPPQQEGIFSKLRSGLAAVGNAVVGANEPPPGPPQRRPLAPPPFIQGSGASRPPGSGGPVGGPPPRPFASQQGPSSQHGPTGYGAYGSRPSDIQEDTGGGIFGRLKSFFGADEGGAPLSPPGHPHSQELHRRPLPPPPGIGGPPPPGFESQGMYPPRGPPAGQYPPPSYPGYPPSTTGPPPPPSQSRDPYYPPQPGYPSSPPGASVEPDRGYGSSSSPYSDYPTPSQGSPEDQYAPPPTYPSTSNIPFPPSQAATSPPASSGYYPSSQAGEFAGSYDIPPPPPQVATPPELLVPNTPQMFVVEDTVILILKPREFYRKKMEMVRAGPTNLQVFSVFEDVFTKFSNDAGEKSVCSEELLLTSQLLQQQHLPALAQIKAQLVEEKDTSSGADVSDEELESRVVDRHNILAKEGIIHIGSLPAIAREALVRSPLRDNVRDVLSSLSLKGVPTYIFSEGFGDLIAQFLLQSGAVEGGAIPQNIRIISNFFRTTPDGTVRGFSQPTVYSKNMNASTASRHMNMPVPDRPYALVFGSSPIGPLCTDGLAVKDQLSIGLLELTENLPEELPVYLRNYDAVVLGDGSLKFLQSVVDDVIGTVQQPGGGWSDSASDSNASGRKPEKRTFFDLYDF